MARRAVILAWLPVVAMSVRFWTGAHAPRFQDPAPWTPEVRRIYDRPGAYDLVLVGRKLVVTYGHSKEPGIAVIDLDTGTASWTALERASALYASKLPDGRVVVFDGEERWVVDSVTGAAHRERAPLPWFRADLAAELVVERTRPVLWRAHDLELAGARSYALPPAIRYPDEVRLDADGRHAWVRGDCGDVLARVDLETGRVLEVPDRRFSWGIAPRDEGGVYETHAVRQVVVARDREGRVLRERWVGGFPRAVVRLAGTPWIAVGQYLGGGVVVLDAETLKTVTRISAGFGVRGIAWDGHRLFWGDGQGVSGAAVR